MPLLTGALCSFQATPLETDPSEQAAFDSKVLRINRAPREGVFGSTITPMRDVNGDGAIDLMVGSPFHDLGDGVEIGGA